jgi:hypothetical protein
MRVSKLKAGLLLFLLTVTLRLEGPAFPQNPKAILIGRCVGQCWYDTLRQEYSFALADTTNWGSIAIRLCSSERSEIAVGKASYNLVIIVDELKKLHKVDVNDAVLLFSRRCRVTRPERVATEFWAIPRGASLPVHEKSIKINELSISIARQQNDKAHMETLLARGEAFPKVTTEPQASSETEAMAQMLRREPDSYGMVVGNYFSRPAAELKRRVLLAKQQLEKHPALRGRFSTHLIPYGINYTDSVEPTEPSFKVIRLSITSGNEPRPKKT